MAERSSRTHTSPRRTPTRAERRIIKVRVLRRWDRPASHACCIWCPRAPRADPLWTGPPGPTGRVIRRYERERPGELVRVDIKKRGNIPDGGGHKVLGRQAARSVSASATATCSTPSTTTPAWASPYAPSSTGRTLLETALADSAADWPTRDAEVGGRRAGLGGALTWARCCILPARSQSSSPSTARPRHRSPRPSSASPIGGTLAVRRPGRADATPSSDISACRGTRRRPAAVGVRSVDQG